MTKIQEHSRSLYKQLHRTVTFLRRQEYFYGMKWMGHLLEEYQQLLTEYVSEPDLMEATGIPAQNLVAVLQNLVAAQQNEDYILLADLLELQVLPFLRQIMTLSGDGGAEWDFGHFMKNFTWLQSENPMLAQEMFGRDLRETDSIRAEWDRYRERILTAGILPEYSEDGSVTMSFEDGTGRFYFHTNIDVMQEAQMLAQSWFSGSQFDYVLYGLGLGYHIEALHDMQKQIYIHVYEANMDVVFMALSFSDMHRWDKSRIRVHIDKDLQGFSGQIKETLQLAGGEVVIHHPSMRALQDEALRSVLKDYFMQYSSARMESPTLRGNFYRNEAYGASSVWELQQDFSGRDVYVVAAGPSLDKNVECLRGVGPDARILATGTVLKKLLNLGIRPNYVIIIDGGEGTYKQVEGVCDCGVPLIYMATVNHDIVKDYHAEKYVIYQQGFDVSEKRAAQCGVKTIQTGGSVATAALDMLLQFGAGRIIWLGLDLAFAGGMSHCADTANRHVSEGTDILMVEDIYGGRVPCGRNLNAYRKWIERRLEQGCGGTEVINATEGGANIRGMINKKLQDVCI